MKKIIGWIIFSSFFYSGLIFSGSWTGFYLGGNVGYWESQTNDIESTGSVSFVNPTYEPGASNIANALAELANNNTSLNPYGLIIGGQAGYNYEINKQFLLGLHFDLDGLTNANNDVTLQKTVNLVDYDENYAGSLEINQRINFLGTARVRLGYLWHPTFLIYATSGFAFGNVTLETSWTAEESLGAADFPTIKNHKDSTDTLTGWVAGAGIEWYFKPQWSSTLEYAYYSLEDLNVTTTLAQTNASISPPAIWGSADANTELSLSVWSIKAGLNYHF